MEVVGTGWPRTPWIAQELTDRKKQYRRREEPGQHRNMTSHSCRCPRLPLGDQTLYTWKKQKTVNGEIITTRNIQNRHTQQKMNSWHKSYIYKIICHCIIIILKVQYEHNLIYLWYICNSKLWYWFIDMKETVTFCFKNSFVIGTVM